MSERKKISRMRVFAGPNGSGKSTIIKEIQKQFRTGPYINSDDIEKASREKGFVNLGDYGLEASVDQFQTYIATSSLIAKARTDNFNIDLTFSDNVIRINNDTNSYEAAAIAEFIRSLLVSKGESFSFETVMSYKGKLKELQDAQASGFKNYLYFISTEDSEINIRRVEQRTLKGGHSVSPEKIVKRYKESMDLLGYLIPFCHRCFIFDNSRENEYRLIAEIERGEEIIIHTEDTIPLWVEKYVFEKLGL